MNPGLLYMLGVIASLSIYLNHVNTLKRIRDKEPIGLNIFFGTICVFLLYLAIVSFR